MIDALDSLATYAAAALFVLVTGGIGVLAFRAVTRRSSR